MNEVIGVILIFLFGIIVSVLFWFLCPVLEHYHQVWSKYWALKSIEKKV